MNRLALWAQRHTHALPRPVRRFAGRVVRGRAATPAPLDDWSAPLVAGRPTADLAAVPLVPAAAPPGPAAPPRTAAPEPAGRSLRCLVAIDVLDVGGMDEFVAFLGRGLPRFGIDTTVAYEDERMPGQGVGGRLVRALRAEGVPAVKLSAADAGPWLATHRPDVISAHGAPEWLLDAAAGLGIPWVETMHGMHDYLDGTAWATERQRAGRIAAKIAVSELVRQQYLAGVPSFNAERVVTIPNGVAPERALLADRSAARAALGLRDEFLFVSLARYHLQKNAFGLVAAFGEVAARHPDAHLLLAGRCDDPLYFAQIRRYVDGLPRADRIHLRGHCASTPAVLAAADAFVLNSFFEGWPLSTMEALAAGVPVVMSEVGGAREQLGDDGARGRLVANPGGAPAEVDWRIINELRYKPQENRAELIAAMSTVVDTRDRWAARRGDLRTEALHSFPADRCLERHAELLRQVVRG